MRRLAVLDLGSNSFHALVADTDSDGRVDPVLREREMLHLSATVGRTGEIAGEALDRATSVAAALADLTHRAGAEELRAVATSAIRDAGNRDDVIDRLSAAVGVPVRLLSGVEEGQLSYLGARASVAVAPGPTLVLDLGGGSLEVVVGDGIDALWAVSLDLGATRLATEHVNHDPLTWEERGAIAARVRNDLGVAVADVAQAQPATSIALGGSVRALARLRLEAWRPLSVNMVPLTRRELRAMADRLLVMDTASRSVVEETRADHLHVAAEILATATEVLGLERVEVSDWGLREGVLLDALGVTSLPDAATLRRRGVDRMATTFPDGGEHAEHVARLALEIFDATTAVHGIDVTDRHLLEAGARLHDVGRSVALKHHDRHGAYLIEHAGLRGYAPWEIAVVSSLVRFHRGDGPDARFPAYASLSPAQKRVTDGLLAVLLLADGMDRARDRAVRDVTVQVRGDAVRLALHGPVPRHATVLTERGGSLFERTFDVTIDVVGRPDAAPGGDDPS